MGLLSLAAKRVVDVGTFIKENASANKLRYSTEANTTHRVYFPVYKDAEGNTVPYILAAPVHSWGDGNTYSACLCTKNIKDGDAFDGSCPVCDRLTDANDIVQYTKAIKEAECTLVGEARKKYLDDMDKGLWRGRKVARARQKFYVALLLLKCDKEGRALVEGDGPKFTLHIASWQESFMQKLLDALSMQDEDEDIGGHEFKLKYGDYADAMTRVGQCLVSVVDSKKQLVKDGSALAAEITETLATFDFEHAIELSRPEAQTKTPAELKGEMNVLFREWDAYKTELSVNPNAAYLEYAQTPAISASTETPAGAPEGALPAGAQAGTSGGEVALDEIDGLLNLS
ncbi:hypothetical protein FACS1894208_02320 [Clostridia bacterium]|nr:hypothetical protein FACS1894208_02320 [Clostridia bacterium]